VRTACIVTQEPFWNRALGSATLMRSRMELLERVFDRVIVLFLSQDDTQSPLPGATIKISGGASREDLADIADYIENEGVELCYFSYALFGELVLEIRCQTAVEIHDVLHLRSESFRKHGFSAPLQISRSEEIENLGRYDLIFSLNLSEATYLRSQGLAGVFYLPPSMPFDELPMPGTEAVGMIGSMAKPNLDGLSRLSDFIESLPAMILAGSLSTADPAQRLKGSGIRRIGIVQDPRDFYRKISLSLSPVRFGAGLKIKVFEALAHGRPVLATEHSIEGFPDGIRDVVTVEDDLSRWSPSLALKAMQIPTEQVAAYFKEHFGQERCAAMLNAALT